MNEQTNLTRKWLTGALTFGAAAIAFSTAALAQTPSPGATVSPGATETAGTMVATTTVMATGTEGTAVATGTAMTGSATAVMTGTVDVPVVDVPANLYQPGGTGNFRFADDAFARVWNRTDSVVAEGRISRTWFWGPGANTPGLLEQYNQGAAGQRLVQYFDKSRMEINNPAGDRAQAFFVTNGLLSVELISGFIQVGDQDYIQYRPACIPMSGDFGDTSAPTYFDFQGVSNTQAGDNNATDRTGQSATDTIQRGGQVGVDESKATIPGVQFVRFENNHNIPQVFWDFLNSTGPVKNDQGQVVDEQLINPWFFASGLPISEPYWARATIQGQLTDVLIQAYERRVLTYVPTNAAGFQVEMGNIGQHYFDWRYRNFGYCPADAVTTPTPPAPAPTTTGEPTSEPNPSETAAATPSGTVEGTVTAPVPVPTGVPTGVATAVPSVGSGSPTAALETSTAGASTATVNPFITEQPAP